ncbi:DUF2218 domain-containing protein [Ruixingdingia sedimenti]|uniref:DUF2218 domain-containing protein n=1 Tax=Ruixingdingia sedimenti TaxID=3073604 RepID=A0ABU1F8I2_9RHOB|nr:DUF2218 domain-containing protein [Xinfangfangia sp. LG-4]MDR5653172.1 DUF2218 domain-containing protein [Xinfangfangia sp. LG-4]
MTQDITGTAAVATAKASGYLQQLCKHFGHKIPVTFDAEAGEIVFPFGTCRLRAEDGALHLTAIAPDAERLAQLQDVIARHLLRFAFREDGMRVDWQAG